MATLTPPLPIRRTASAGALHLWHLTSLDAVTVAVTWTLAFAWALDVRLPWWPPVVVALSAWSFYIADRLFDALGARTPLRPRHLFHWRHRRVFAPLAACCALLALALVAWKMPLRVEIRDSLIAAAALAYFAGVHATRKTALPHPGRSPAQGSRRLRIPKELLVAIVFTAACAAPALTHATARLPLVPLLAAFIALAWLNCHAIESWESQGSKAVRPAALRLAAVTLAGAAIAVVFHAGRVGMLLAAAAVSSALLAVLDQRRERLSPLTLRALADLVLLMPLALGILP